MNMDQEAMTQRVTELVRPILAGRQVDLVELTCRNAGPRVLVRILADTAKGITIAELSHINQAVGALLEEHDLIPGAYTLEVSSPGLDRPLKTPLDYERVIGRRIKVSTNAPVNSKWEYAGELLNANDEAIVLKLDNGEKQQILLSMINRAVQDFSL